MLAASSNATHRWSGNMRVSVAGWFSLFVLLVGCNTSKPPAPPLVALEEDVPQNIESSSTASGVVPVDPALPKYVPVSGVDGSIKSAGSDTMSNLMALWTGGFRKFYPAVNVAMEGKGTSTAPPALI